MSNKDRRAELVSAAVGDELTDDERAELAAMAAADPTVDVEVDELRRVVARMSAVDKWDDAEPSRDLRRRVLDIDRQPQSTRWSRPVVAAAAAACVLVGAAGVLGFQAATSGAVTGPPGTLGAYEAAAFVASPGLSVDGGLVAHTWGTESILDIADSADSTIYEVFLIERSGEAASSGSFVGTEASIDCRMNAAVDRPDVAGIEIRTSTGSVVARAEVPTVTS